MIETRRCPICGTEFVVEVRRGVGRRYCCDKCRREGQRRRNREWMRAYRSQDPEISPEIEAALKARDWGDSSGLRMLLAS
jgi:hypothetical protein